MLKILMLSLLLIVIAFPSFARCGPPNEIDTFLSKEFKEKKIWTGLSDISKTEQQLTFIYENPKTGSWTIAFYSLENDKTCILMMGYSSTFSDTKPKGSKS